MKTEALLRRQAERTIAALETAIAEKDEALKGCVRELAYLIDQVPCRSGGSVDNAFQAAKAALSSEPAGKVLERAEDSGAADALARMFHSLYEEMAPDHGYETREETREFDPASKNGRLMIAVCNRILTGKVCEWTQEDWDADTYGAACGAEWSFIEGGPTDNQMKFCPVCGLPLVEINYDEGKRRAEEVDQVAYGEQVSELQEESE